ncbi:MAG: hypothetical protein M0C28_44905 [Candidatus Moduliflexus flocculans]|nr:hypothetical protein [Candidatus Moduliflexus flocculans]
MTDAVRPRSSSSDPYVAASKTETAASRSFSVSPCSRPPRLPGILEALRTRSREVFAAAQPAEIQDAMARLDSFSPIPPVPRSGPSSTSSTASTDSPSTTSSASAWASSVPSSSYDRASIGRFVEAGLQDPAARRDGLRPPPALRPEFPLHREARARPGQSFRLGQRRRLLGHPDPDRPAARDRRGRRGGTGAGERPRSSSCPSTSAVFPMLYLSKMGEVAPLVRATIACGYWKGGDAAIEDPLLAASDAVNVLGSEATVRDVEARARAPGPQPHRPRPRPQGRRGLHLPGSSPRRPPSATRSSTGSSGTSRPSTAPPATASRTSTSRATTAPSPRSSSRRSSAMPFTPPPSIRP